MYSFKRIGARPIGLAAAAALAVGLAAAPALTTSAAAAEPVGSASIVNGTLVVNGTNSPDIVALGADATSVQVVFDNDDAAQMAKAKRLRSEYVVGVQGTVRRRSPETINPKLETGEVEVFVRQLEYTLREGDVVVAISVSGNSPNVLAAIEYALEVGARTVALTGFDGGRLRTLADVTVHVPTNRGEYGPADEEPLSAGPPPSLSQSAAMPRHQQLGNS